VWLVFNVLHLSYHMQHLGMYGTRNQVLNVVTLTLLVLSSAALLGARTPRAATGGHMVMYMIRMDRAGADRNTVEEGGPSCGSR